MSEFEQSIVDLTEFLAERKNHYPRAIVQTITLALQQCLNPIPDADCIHIILRTNEVLGVQKFVTQFGCHLKRVYTFPDDNQKSKYIIQRNW
ncbi:MAG: hypothetical protein ACI4U9_05205 [Clostridia bacterium]